MEPQMRDRDLVLPPNTFAFVLDSTKGKVSVYVGPYKSSLSNTDRLVIWDGNEFVIEDDVDEAKSTFVKANEGQYIVLSDPAVGEPSSHPPLGTTTDKTELAAGSKTIIPGPASFPLWPGQVAEAIDGHHLKSNQYLLVRVYQPEQAQKYAETAVVALTEGTKKAKRILGEGPLTMGQLLVIKGTDETGRGVSFFIPPTGIEVVPDEVGNFVRNAVTLERMEYAILLDEDGEKRYVRGPAVVFPQPTEQFVTNADGESKARAIELNAQSGLYAKCIADYKHEDEFTFDVVRSGKTLEVKTGHQVREGDELFITGKHTPIYFPRPEHMILMYRQQRKHHAIAIPRGEGRYVLERDNGNVKTVRGPVMFLPDPRHEVNVQRILDPELVKVMFPGNAEALKINQELSGHQARVENVLTGQEVALDAAVMASSTAMPPAQVEGAQYVNLASNIESASAEDLMRSSSSGKQTRKGRSGNLGETATRGTKFTKPRTVVLDTKYQGAVQMGPWAGYAVLITNRAGQRRVEIGPKPLLLDYDETPMVLSLSTGRPKTDRQLHRAAYLQVINNQVSDRITVETADLVPLTIDLCYRVNFENDPTKWFNVENYVQLLCDHGRSRVRNAAKRHKIETFYGGYIDIIRDALLGTPSKDASRPGLPFKENGMRVYDVEVLDARITDPDVGELILGATKNAMVGTLQLAQARDQSERDEQFEDLKRHSLTEIEKTRLAEHKAAMAKLERELAHQLQGAAIDLQLAEEVAKESAIGRQEAQLTATQEFKLLKARDAVQLERLHIETDEFIRRMGTLQGGVIEALQAFGDKVFVKQLIEGLGPAALVAGGTTADILNQVFKGTQFEEITQALAHRPYVQANGAAVEGATH